MIEYSHVSRIYRSEHRTVHAVEDVSLRVESGELCVLLGASGCGKTTLLRMTNRLIEPTSGTIRIDGHDTLSEDPVALRRRIGYVIQSVGLFPHWTVAENIATTLRLIGASATKIASRVDELLELLNLDPSRYRNRYPAELSGGESQRVGVARALAADPPLLLMDEPFGAVDPINRAEIGRSFRELQQRLRKTTIFVSHDIGEALFLADRIALMHNGRIVQSGSPGELIRTPANDYVARFFGEHRGLLLLGTLSVADAVDPEAEASDDLPTITAASTLQEALSTLLTTGASGLTIVDGDRRTPNVVTLGSIRTRTAIAAKESTR